MANDATIQLPTLLTSTEAARQLRISARTLWQYSFPRGKLRTVKIGSRTLFDPVDLVAFIQASKAGGEI